MEEQEVSIEQVQDIVHEHHHKVSWAEKVALTTALLAVFAAISSLLSTHQSDEAILNQIRASDQWGYYQAKSIKALVAPTPEERSRYKAEQEEIKKDAEEKDQESQHSMHVHEFFAYAVTLFQVATAIGAIAVLVKKKSFWYTSLTLGGIGIVLVVKAIILFHR